LPRLDKQGVEAVMLPELLDRLRHQVLRLAGTRYQDVALRAKHHRYVAHHYELIRTLSLMLRKPDLYPLAVAIDILAELQGISTEFPDLAGAGSFDVKSCLADVVSMWVDSPQAIDL
jgi:hypothetical protein